MSTPEIQVIGIEVADPIGPYGAKGVGEIGLVPTAAAVANAFYQFDQKLTAIGPKVLILTSLLKIQISFIFLLIDHPFFTADNILIQNIFSRRFGDHRQFFHEADFNHRIVEIFNYFSLELIKSFSAEGIP